MTAVTLSVMGIPITAEPPPVPPAPVFAGWVEAGTHLKLPDRPGEVLLWLAEVTAAAGGACNWWVDLPEEFFADHWVCVGERLSVPRCPGYVLTCHEVGRLGWVWGARISLERDQLP